MSLRPPRKPPSAQHFTPFHSAAEELAMVGGPDVRGLSGDHMSSLCGRVVRTPGAATHPNNPSR